MKWADLHTHTTASDGLHRPAHVVRMAQEAGLAAVAITDHDTVAGLADAAEAGRKLGVVVVPGVEISTVADGRDIHVLGYGFAPDNPRLLERLVRQRGARDRRNAAMVDRLRALGMAITLDDVIREAERVSPGRAGRSIGRPHFAALLVDRGYASDMRDAFDRWLAAGRPGYVPQERVAPQEAIAWIADAGGKAIVAHPGLYGNDALVESLLDGAGAAGVEAWHSDHSEEQERHYEAMARSRGKLATGGSDFHGSREGAVFHGPVGGRRVDMAVVEQLLG